MKQKRSTNSREVILDAAEAVVQGRGALGLTLDAVAARAGVSKGGLLYHFPSKDALLEAMVARIARMARQHFTEELAKEPEGRGRHAHVFLRMLLGGKGSFFPLLQRMATPLFVAIAGNPELLAPMRAAYGELHQAMIQDGLPPERAWLILSALDGIKFWRILQFMEPSGLELKRLRILLERLIDGEEVV
ncbi:MAG: TetR/AcrR family transcriptional regulator [Kiritimatiellae bacterium]|nr:TetR/AcrR family transcriptional regulator [Kiritimatiellia bacterium]MDD4735082.1 TetR/AcrR family transcriptional regulator [Kiritimatiellia bacterium]